MSETRYGTLLVLCAYCTSKQCPVLHVRVSSVLPTHVIKRASTQCACRPVGWGIGGFDGTPSQRPLLRWACRFTEPSVFYDYSYHIRATGLLKHPCPVWKSKQRKMCTSTSSRARLSMYTHCDSLCPSRGTVEVPIFFNVHDRSSPSQCSFVPRRCVDFLSPG